MGPATLVSSSINGASAAPAFSSLGNGSALETTRVDGDTTVAAFSSGSTSEVRTLTSGIFVSLSTGSGSVSKTSLEALAAEESSRAPEPIGSASPTQASTAPWDYPASMTGQKGTVANRSNISSNSPKPILLLFCKKMTSIKEQHQREKPNYIQDLPL